MQHHNTNTYIIKTRISINNLNIYNNNKNINEDKKTIYTKIASFVPKCEIRQQIELVLDFSFAIFLWIPINKIR